MEPAPDASALVPRHRFHLPSAHLPHGLVTFPRRLMPWIEPWFLAYACLGVVQGGMLPLLLPLSAGGSTHAGAIVGVMNLAGITAPFWGHLADRHGLHRQVLLAGMLAALVALLLMPTPLGLPLKTLCAAVLGVGFAASNTVAKMFIVEVRPREEWDARIGAAGAQRSRSGCRPVARGCDWRPLCACLRCRRDAGGRFGARGMADLARCSRSWSCGLEAAAHPPRSGGEAWAGSPQRMFHISTWHGLRTLLALNSELPFARLMIVWFVASAVRRSAPCSRCCPWRSFGFLA